MERYEVYENFITELERERIKLDLSQEEMASALAMSYSSYKKLVTRQTRHIDVYTIYRLYLLSNRFACEFVGHKDVTTHIVGSLHNLTYEQLKFVDSVIEFLLKGSD